MRRHKNRQTKHWAPKRPMPVNRPTEAWATPAIDKWAIALRLAQGFELNKFKAYKAKGKMLDVLTLKGDIRKQKVY